MNLFPDFSDHAPFVWSAYGVALLMLALLAVIVCLRGRSAKLRLEEMRRVSEARKNGNGHTTPGPKT